MISIESVNNAVNIFPGHLCQQREQDYSQYKGIALPEKYRVAFHQRFGLRHRSKWNCYAPFRMFWIVPCRLWPDGRCDVISSFDLSASAEPSTLRQNCLPAPGAGAVTCTAGFHSLSL